MAKEIAETMSKSQNKVFLDADTLLLNVNELITNGKGKKK